MDRLEQVLQKYNFQKRFDKPKMASEEVEKIIKFKLPEDYKFFALNYLEFEDSIGPEYVRLWNFDEILEMNFDYQIFEYLPKTLAIGGNGGGDYIAIEQLENEGLRIILSPFITIEKEAHLEIGNSFTDFLERLNNGKEWFR
jgi:hypothetical protein